MKEKLEISERLRELITQYKNGNEQAFIDLLDLLHPYISYYTCKYHSLEDIEQICKIRIAKVIDVLDIDKVNISYFAKSISNACKVEASKQQRHKRAVQLHQTPMCQVRDIDLCTYPTQIKESNRTSYYDNFNLRDYEHLLQILNDTERKLIQLYLKYDGKHQYIAEEMGISRSYVRFILCQIRKKINKRKNDMQKKHELGKVIYSLTTPNDTYVLYLKDKITGYVQYSWAENPNDIKSLEKAYKRFRSPKQALKYFQEYQTDSQEVQDFVNACMQYLQTRVR